MRGEKQAANVQQVYPRDAAKPSGYNPILSSPNESISKATPTSLPRPNNFKLRRPKMQRTTKPVQQNPQAQPAVGSDPRLDEAFFEGLVQQCDQRVYRLALRITRNHQDAEEARQETMLKAYRHLDQFEGRARFTTWISRIAINEALMTLRKRRDSLHVPLEAASEHASQDPCAPRLFPTPESPDTSFDREQLRGALMEAIGALSPIHREVFILRTVEQCSTSETAKALALTESAVKTRLRRARMQLRNALRARWEAEAV